MSVWSKNGGLVYRMKIGDLTCQANGRLLRFRRAKMRARNFQAPALSAKPNLLRSVDKVGAIVVWEGLMTCSGGRIAVRRVGQACVNKREELRTEPWGKMLHVESCQ